MAFLSSSVYAGSNSNPIPFKDGNEVTGQMTHVLIGVILFLFIVAIGVAIAKKRFVWKPLIQLKSSSRELKLLETLYLDKNHTLHLVDYQGRKLLIGCSIGGGVVLIDQSLP